MRKLFTLLFALIILSAPVSYVKAELGEKIVSFDSDAVIQEDGTVNIKEVIEYEFGGNDKHGIYRNISLKSSQGRSMDVSNVNVVSENYIIENNGNNLRIRIGDPDKYVSGLKTYTIEYTVDNALGFFSDHDELYWNFTGTEWDVPIESATGNISLSSNIIIKPTSISTSTYQLPSAWCYQGSYGSKEQCAAQLFSGIRGAQFESTRKLEEGEGMSGAYGFERGIFVPPLEKSIEKGFGLESLSSLGMGGKVGLMSMLAIFLGAIGYMIKTWFNKGRDSAASGTIVPQYDVQEGMSPILSEALVKRRVESRGVTAQIIDLAIRGHIKITRIEKKGMFGKVDYQFDLLNSSGLKSEYDTTLLEGLFGSTKTSVRSSTKANKLAEELSKLNQISKKEMASRGWYQFAKEVGNKIPFVITVFASFAIGIIEFLTLGSVVLGIVSLLILGIVATIFYMIMDRFTEAGVREREYLLGLKEYLQIAEKDRLAFHNAPEKNPELFEKLLPYAIVFGVEEKWAKEFETMTLPQPEWYSSSSLNTFTSVLLANEMSNLSSASSHMYSHPSSSTGGSMGGGFSGGGGGGGGGGSW